jgi:hypothetical protein
MTEIFKIFKPKKQRIVTPKIDWSKTRLAEERIKETDFYEEKGLIRKEKYFQGRPIIGRDRPINGGVYLGGSEREAIVVDDKKDEQLEKIYKRLLDIRQLAEQNGKSFKDGILNDVWELVDDVMPYDKINVKRVNNALPGQDSKVYLSSFLGGGICRHQALLTAYLLERLAKEGKVNGKVSVDRNYVSGIGGHAWARYTNSAGEVFILDTAQNYIGKLKDINHNRWFYERPEENGSGNKLLANLRRAFSRD